MTQYACLDLTTIKSSLWTVHPFDGESNFDRTWEQLTDLVQRLGESNVVGKVTGTTKPEGDAGPVVFSVTFVDPDSRTGQLVTGCFYGKELRLLDQIDVPHEATRDDRPGRTLDDAVQFACDRYEDDTRNFPSNVNAVQLDSLHVNDFDCNWYGITVSGPEAVEPRTYAVRVEL